MLKNLTKRQDFIMIHMGAIITLSVFCKKADASLADFKVSLIGIFQHICLLYRKQFLQRLGIAAK
jgi:hypothetical protein